MGLWTTLECEYSTTFNWSWRGDIVAGGGGRGGREAWGGGGCSRRIMRGLRLVGLAGGKSREVGEEGTQEHRQREVQCALGPRWCEYNTSPRLVGWFDWKQE